MNNMQRDTGAEQPISTSEPDGKTKMNLKCEIFEMQTELFARLEIEKKKWTQLWALKVQSKVSTGHYMN